MRYLLLGVFLVAGCGSRSNLDDLVEGISDADTGGDVTAPEERCGQSLEPVLWLVADIGVSVDPSGGVSTWADQSPGHNDAIQSNIAERPSGSTRTQGARRVVFFDGVDDHLTLPEGFRDFTGGLTAFVVVRPEATNPIYAPRFFDFSRSFGSLAESILFVRYDDRGEMLFYQTYFPDAPGPFVGAPHEVLDGQWQIFAVVAHCGAPLAQERATIFSNGREVASSSVAVPALVTRRSNFIARANQGPKETFLRGAIAEIRVYRGAMTPSERQIVETSLRSYWSL